MDTVKLSEDTVQFCAQLAQLNSKLTEFRYRVSTKKVKSHFCLTFAQLLLGNYIPQLKVSEKSEGTGKKPTL